MLQGCSLPCCIRCLPNTWDLHVDILFFSHFIDSTFSEDMCCTQDCWSLEVVYVVGIWDFPHIALALSIYYPSCPYDDGYDCYFLFPHPLALNLEICVLTYLLCGLLLDIIAATSMKTNLWVPFFWTIKSGLLHEMCLSVMTGESHRMVASSFSTTCSGFCWYQCQTSTVML